MGGSVLRDFASRANFRKHSMMEGRELPSCVTGKYLYILEASLSLRILLLTTMIKYSESQFGMR